MGNYAFQIYDYTIITRVWLTENFAITFLWELQIGAPQKEILKNSKNSMLWNLDSWSITAKGKNVLQNSTKHMALKLVPGYFAFIKNWTQALLQNEVFEISWFYWIRNSKINKQTSSASFLREFFKKRN